MEDGIVVADGYWGGAGRGAAARQTLRFVSFCSLFSVSILLSRYSVCVRAQLHC